MKVLFVSTVSRANKALAISPIVQAQGQSLQRVGVNVDYFTIRGGRGASAYLESIPRLKQLIRDDYFDLVHAHYVYPGFAAMLAGAHPLVVSLMGSDVNERPLWRQMVRLCARRRWAGVVVKSRGMRDKLGIDGVQVIPNGVDLQLFRPLDRHGAQLRVGFGDGKHVLFAANPDRSVKNFALARAAVDRLGRSDVMLQVVYQKPQAQLPYYYNASDVVLLTSHSEGSPNVIKEAMACSRPIVSTDVGDVVDVIGGTEGCYIADANPADVATKLALALERSLPTNGRSAIRDYESDKTAAKIRTFYEQVLRR